MSISCPALSIGRAARAALADGADGRVLAVFRRSLYVEMDFGRLACIGAAGLGDGPLNLRASLPEGLDLEHGGIAAGDEAAVAEDRLSIGSLLSVDLSAAAPWRPAPPVEFDPAGLSRGLDLVCEAIASAADDVGLAAAIVDRPTAGDDPVRDLAAPAIAALSAWLCEALPDPDGTVSTPDDAAILIGLGPGLTPAGDDLLGGAMIALRAAGHAGPARRLAEWVLPLAQQRTGKISIAHLAAAASGEGAAALHDAINAICTADGDALARALAALDAIGHSSGWDALAGAVLALRCVSRTSG